MTEQWVEWRPIREPLGVLRGESIKDCDGVLDISLRDALDAEKKVHMFFDCSVLAYRFANESYRLKTMFEINTACNAGASLMSVPFCEVFNSEFLQLVADADSGKHNNLRHFVIADAESFLDVIATEAPRVDVGLRQNAMIISGDAEGLNTPLLRCTRKDLGSPTSKVCTSDEQWVRWKPIEGLAPRYQLDLFFSTTGKDEIVLVDAENWECKIRLKFCALVDIYRKRSISPLHKFYKENALNEWAFFKVLNSHYVSWVEEESYGTRSGGLQHYAFVVGDFILEVLDNTDPQVEPLMAM